MLQNNDIYQDISFLVAYQYNGINGYDGLMQIQDYNKALAINNNNAITMLKDVNVTLYCGGGTNGTGAYIKYVINGEETLIGIFDNSYDWCGKVVTLSLKKGDTFAIDYKTGETFTWAPLAMVVTCFCT